MSRLAWADIFRFGRLIPETRGVSLEQMDNLFAEFRGTQTAKLGDSLKGSGGDSLMSQQAAPDVATL